MSLDLDQITEITVLNEIEDFLLLKGDFIVEDEAISFEIKIPLELKNFNFFIFHSDETETHLVGYVKGYVTQKFTLTFDLDSEEEYVFKTFIDPKEIDLLECSDERELKYFKMEMIEQIYDEFCNGLDIAANSFEIVVKQKGNLFYVRWYV